MIDPATTWFKIVELPTVTKLTIPNMGKGKMVTCCDYTKEADTTFDKSSAQITNLVYKTWFIQYPFCQCLMYNNGSKFKLHLWTLCNTYGIKHKPTSVKSPQANAILEHIMPLLLPTTEINMANSVKFRLSMGNLLYLPYGTKSRTRCSNIWTRHALWHSIYSWLKKLGEIRQQLTDLNSTHENEGRIDYDYQVGQKVLIRHDGILCKAESRYLKKPWTITSVHTNRKKGFNLETNLKGYISGK
jgi:hypothetical protein